MSIRRTLRLPPTLQPCRSITTTSRTHYQHVLYFGEVLGYTSNSRFSKFARSWLDSVGVSADVDAGLKWQSVAGGVNHVLLGYTLVDPPMTGRRARREDVVVPGQRVVEEEEREEGEVIDVGGRRAVSSHPSKVFSLGRNTHAQLGLGFSSQEATRGMVTGELSGSGGVHSVVAGGGFSFVVTQEGQESHVFGFGNDTLGQLGSSPATSAASLDPYDISTRLSGSDQPQLCLLPLPKRVDLGQGGWRVCSAAAGLDHTVVLVERVVNGYVVQQVMATGLNTDGQLGVTPAEGVKQVPIEPLLTRAFGVVPLPLQSFRVDADEAGRVTEVVCGADTSFALTANSDLWVWGNSEYGQSLAGVHDRIVAPVFVANPLPAAYDDNGLPYQALPKVTKLVAGGSFAAILDSYGRVWVVGHGPRGGDGGPDDKLTLIQGWPQCSKAEALFCGLEYIIAVTRGEQLEVYIWGIPPRFISSLPIVDPTRVPFSTPKTPRQTWLDENPRLKEEQAAEPRREVKVEAAACTRDHVLLILNDGQGRDVWAECDQPPSEKGTDITL